MKTKRYEQEIGLVSVEECKRVLGIDDREDGLVEWLVAAASREIEAFCMRKFNMQRYTEIIDFWGSECQALGEWPVRKVSSVQGAVSSWKKASGGLPKTGGVPENRPYFLNVGAACRRVRVVYWAGYTLAEMPEDLKLACFELITWNYGRFKAGKLGVVGSEKKGGEKFEAGMPEHVRELAGRYRRICI
jgi:hypothetical protein